MAITEFTLVATRQKRAFIDSNLDINIEGQPVKKVNNAKTLGLYIQQYLSWVSTLGIYTKILVLL